MRRANWGDVMSKKPTGGPAFPGVDHLGEVYPGMTLRDYFAAKAMQGLLSDRTIQASRNEFAGEAYSMADAMLEARK